MSIGIMQERPPYVRFEIGTREWRDNSGASHSVDVEQILVTPAGAKDVHVANAEEWIGQKESLARQNPPQYPPQWANAIRASFDMWKKGVEIPADGTSIRAWPVLTPSEVKRCIDANILIVEDLAQANEPALQRLGMGAIALKQKAQAWISERDGPGAAVQQVAALKVENVELKRQVDQLRESVEQMARQIAEQPGAKRGRKATRDAPDLSDDRDVIR